MSCCAAAASTAEYCLQQRVIATERPQLIDDEAFDLLRRDRFRRARRSGDANVVAGSKLIATNLDPSCPTEKGVQQGCGALVALLEAATGVKALSVGKLRRVMIRAARKELDLTTDQTRMIGDTMETDILGGVQLGIRTVLVLNGGTKQEDLSRYAYRPDPVVSSLADYMNNMIDAG